MESWTADGAPLSVFCPSVLTVGSTLTASGVALSAFEEADSCSASWVESALLEALGVPSEVASAGLACCDKSFTLLCTDLRLLGVAFGDGRGLERLSKVKTDFC